MLLQYVSNLGLLSFGALVLFLLRITLDVSRHAVLSKVFIGCTFGALSVMVVNVPLSIPNGATFDTRAGPAILSAFYAGPVAGLLTAAIGAVARYHVGGPAVVGGILSFVFYAGAGWAAGYYLLSVKRRLPTLRDLVAISAFGTLLAVPALFIGSGIDFGLNLLAVAWPYLLLGNVSGVVVLGLTTREVLRAKQNQDALSDAVITADLARASAQLALWQYDRAMDRVTLDEAGLALYGLDPETFSGSYAAWRDRILEEDRPGLDAAIASAQRTGAAFDITVRVRQDKDRPRWIRATGQFRLEGGRPGEEAIGVHSDITDLRQLEADLRQTAHEASEKSRNLEVTLSSMKHGVAVLDKDGCLVLVNQRALDLFDMPPEVATAGRHYTTFLRYHREHGNFHLDPDEAMRRIWERIGRGEIYRSRIQLASGRVLAVTVAPMPDGGWVETHEDITEQERAAAQLREAAERDGLTGLANRAAFDQALEEAVRRSAAGASGQALMLVDLNDFKTVNDSYGHSLGDAVLKRGAATLDRGAGDRHLAARLGGDEFAILFRHGMQADDKPEAQARRVIDEVTRTHVFDGLRVKLGVSIGIAAITPDCPSRAEIMTRADSALYKIKSQREIGFRVFDKTIEREITRRKRLEGKLLTAANDETFALHYQPIINLADDRVVGHEALLRWQCPNGMMVPPSEFIPIAEDLGTIDDLGLWVLETAVMEAMHWPANVCVSVNVSPRQLGKDMFVGAVERVLAKWQLDPARLEFEITENVLIERNDATLAEIQALRALGTRIALDDFGTGFSSLSYLHRFPLDKIKIDRAFVSRITSDHTSASIVSTIANLARNIGLDTTAEGIETEEQKAFLALAGCTNGQGFLIGRPQAEPLLPEALVHEPARR